MTLGMAIGDLGSHTVDSSPYAVFKDSLLNTGLFIKNNLPTAFTWATTAIDKINYIPQVFNLTYRSAAMVISCLVYIVRHVLRGAGIVIWLIFEPFYLVIHIIEYNAYAFINIWLQLLFDTSLENLLSVEYGMSQIKVVAQWIRFINVMCITGMVLGISTYYTLIRVVYWLTKLDNKSKAKNKQMRLKQQLKETSDLKKRSDLVSEFEALRQHPRLSPQRAGEPPSLLEEFIQREEEALRSESQQTINIQESTPPSISNASTISNTNDQSIDHVRYERILRDDQDDEIYNYESLNSLASGSSTTVSSPLQSKEDSPISRVFRSRLSSLNSTQSDDSAAFGTFGSSVFSSTRTSGSGLPPITPITTIAEDVEDEFDEGQHKETH